MIVQDVRQIGEDPLVVFDGFTYVHMHVYVCVCVFVCHCLATKVFIG